MKLLDLFAGEGGCSVGYARAGFTVTGVERIRKRTYPIGDHGAGSIVEMLHVDALDVLADLDYLRTFDLIHASPPCQAYSAGTRTLRANGTSQHPDLYDATRAALVASGRPWIIENVPGSPIGSAVTLCGTQFDQTAEHDGINLVLQRHRYFETTHLLWAPGPCRHDYYARRGYRIGGVYGNGSRTLEHAKQRGGGYTPPPDVQRELMGMPWATNVGVTQAIPPIYAEWIGRQMAEAIASPLESIEVRR